MKYSMFIWGSRNLNERIKKLAKLGYDAVELLGEPDLFKAQDRKTLKSCCIDVSSVSLYFPGHMPERDLASPNPTLRNKAIDYAKRCIAFASDIGAPLIIVLPTIEKMKVTTAIKKKWELAVKSIKEIGTYAMDFGVQVCVEPINRYGSCLVNTSKEAKKFIEDVQLDNIKIMLDCYHMYVEKENIAEAIRNIGKDLAHIHVADVNNEGRRVPVGSGNLNFCSIIESLKEIGYRGYLTMEASTKDYLSVEKGAINEEYIFKFAADSIRYLLSLNQNSTSDHASAGA
jgi:sugar phosphate isomerase/epimerase